MNFALTKDDNKAELLSICINFMKFPLAIMVVVLHSTLIGKPIERVGIDNIDAIAPQYSSITWFFGNFIGNCAVPIFFIISGFLLFYNIEKYTAATYAYKMKKRLAQVRKSVDSPPGMLTKRSSSHGTCFPIKSSTFASWQRRLPNLTTRYSYATCFQKGCLTPLKLPMSMKSALVYTMRRIRKSAFFISILTNVTCAMMCGMI